MKFLFFYSENVLSLKGKNVKTKAQILENIHDKMTIIKGETPKCKNFYSKHHL